MSVMLSLLHHWNWSSFRSFFFKECHVLLEPWGPEGQALQANKVDDWFQSSELVSWGPLNVPTGLGFICLLHCERVDLSRLGMFHCIIVT